VAGARLERWMSGSGGNGEWSEESIKVREGMCSGEVVMVKEKKRVPMRRVVPRLGRAVEREACVVGDADETRGRTAWE